MDDIYLINTIYKYKKDTVYFLNPEVYPIEENNFIIVSTFFAKLGISATLNSSARVFFLLIDGKRTAKDIYEKCLDIFEGVSREKLLEDLLMLLNKFERQSLIKSKVEYEREIKLYKHYKECLELRLSRIRNSLDLSFDKEG